MKHQIGHAARLATLMLITVIAMVQALPAVAQEVGTYNGTLDNGDPISVSVAADKAGHLSVSGVIVTTTQSIQCNFGSITNPNVFSIYGDFPISGGTASTELYFATEIFSASMNFAGSTVSGTFTGIIPAFSSFVKRPKKGLVCTVPSQNFSATLSQ